MLKLRVPGVATTSRGDGGFGEFASVVGAEVKLATRVDATRTAAADRAGILTDADESDVLQLTWDRDVVELVRVGELRERFGEQTRGASGEFVIPTSQVYAAGQRGEGALRLSAVEHIALETAQKLTEAVLPEAIRAIEARLMPRPGLFELDAGGELGRRVEGSSQLPAHVPLLVLLHGCFSDTRHSFRDLFASKEWRVLHDGVVLRGGQVLALEHHTVTQSPIQNALELARVLPQGARLQFLSYSRGGLIGDLIIRHPWQERDATHFFSHDHYPEAFRDELRALSALLGDAQVTVERYLRVAAPAAGTLLASKRLDVYLNVILSMLTKLLEAGAPWLCFVKAIATQIVATRTQPEACPGLEAMMPHLDRGLVPFLNAAPRSSGEELAVIAGDVEEGHAFQRVKAFFADLYFQEDNDFVVDTRSMYRGVPRARAWAHLHTGPKAHHFGYFSDEGLRGRILDWLGRGDATQFRPLEEATAEVEARGGAFGFGLLAAGELPHVAGRDVVVLLPGIMGSHLSLDGDRIWVDFWSLAWGGLRKLAIGAGKVAAAGVIEGYYGQLAKYLSRTWNVEIFAFDWRRPIAESAAHLQAKLAALHASGVRVRLIAHSMGGLVSRACIAKDPGLWREIVQRGGRLVMLGTPNFGSYVPARAFARQHALLRTIERLDVTSDLDQLTSVVRAFPGLLEMLPRRAGHDLLAFAAWKGFESHRPGSAELERASTFREWLDPQAIQPDSMVYVAGQAPETPVAMALREGKVMFQMSSCGDGTVPWELGILPNVDTYYVDSEHGDLAKHERSFAGYHDLLQSGRTTSLVRSPARGVRAAEAERAERRWVSEEQLPEFRYYPSEADLLGVILGGSPRTQRSRPVAPIAIEVLNANVQHARYPVLVGHYLGDPIVSAERALDSYQQGELGRDHRLGLYPGELNTTRVYGRHQRGSRPGAIVVGLGMVGQLTRPRLQSTLSTALLEYALSPAAQLEGAGAIGVSSLLVGTWGTRLSVDDCVTALVDAAREVNAKLAAETSAAPVCIAAIQLVELYRDMASDAVRAARRLAVASDGAITAQQTVTSGRDIRRSRPSSPYGSGWQRHISIKATPAGEFTYEHITELARTDEMKRDVQWSHVKPLLASLGTDSVAPATLFHYLLPFGLGELTRESPDLVLHLDIMSAQIPWEILRPHADAHEPLGVRSGILRTLTVRGDQPVRRAPGRSALVIGEPVNVQPALPGARAEALDVTARLEQRGVKVRSLVNRTADEILSALYQDTYDIIHIAAHGEFPEARPPEAEAGRAATRRLEAPPGAVEPPQRSGVVLEMGRYLTASEFATLRAVPSIVFLNCCHLGKLAGVAEDVKPSLPGAWGANVASELIRMGVGVVVVAGWAVSDTAARTFANTLYTGLLEGRNLMSALREARKQTYDVSPMGDVTWGAYQVYGSPGFVMRHALKNGDAPMPVAEPVSRSELVDYLLDIATRAGRPSTDADTGSELTRELDELQEGLKDTLAYHGDVQCAFGNAYACLGEYAAAAKAYARALKSSDAPLQAAEQLADVEVRQAEQWWFAARARINTDVELDAQANEAFDRSSRRLKSLIDISASAERSALLGANLRRRAKCTDDPEARKPLLLEARQAYAEAVKQQADNQYYHLTQVESMNLCVDPSTVIPANLELAKQLAKPWLDREPFAALAEVDADLILHAARIAAYPSASLPDPLNTPPSPRPGLSPKAVELSRQIAARYGDVLGAGSDRRRHGTVTSHLETLRRLVTHPAVAEWLRLVQERVSSRPGSAAFERPAPPEPRRSGVDERKAPEAEPA
jgi:tetratricopeptide (TPR) repeat protein